MADKQIDCNFESNPDDTDVGIMPVACSGREQALLSRMQIIFRLSGAYSGGLMPLPTRQ
jgi:hypothetical protein